MTDNPLKENETVSDEKANAQMVPKPLPCPFCGGEAALGGNSEQAFVNCVECLASTDSLSTGMAWTEAEAIAAWNMRVTPPATVAALVEALVLLDKQRDKVLQAIGSVRPMSFDGMTHLFDAARAAIARATTRSAP